MRVGVKRPRLQGPRIATSPQLPGSYPLLAEVTGPDVEVVHALRNMSGWKRGLQQTLQANTTVQMSPTCKIIPKLSQGLAVLRQDRESDSNYTLLEPYSPTHLHHEGLASIRGQVALVDFLDCLADAAVAL